MGKASAEYGGNKSWETNTQSGQQGFDPLTEKYRQMIMQASEGAGAQVPQSVQQALGFFSGNPNSQQQFMNPYQGQVIDQINNQYKVGNQMTMNAVDDAATTANAYGGARHGIATGTALAQNTQNRDAQIAGLLQSGFEGAAGRAGQAANLGMMAGSPELWRLMQLKQGFNNLPYGQTFSGTSGSTKTGTNYNASGKIGLFGG